MLFLRGTLRAATKLGGNTNKKTGELIPVRDVLQVETTDSRGLVQVTTITVPDLKPYAERSGSWSPFPSVHGLLVHP